jgi:hypothetical protein
VRKPQPPIPKPAKSPPPPESCIRPGLRNPGHLRRGGRGTSNSTHSRKLCSGPLAGFYFGVDNRPISLPLGALPYILHNAWLREYTAAFVSHLNCDFREAIRVHISANILI